jgi:hypothetical protein
MSSNKHLLFLTGIGRSGTTLLQKLLNAHSQISFEPETHFFKRFILPFQIDKKVDLQNFGKSLEDDKYLKRLSDKKRNHLIASAPELRDCIKRFDDVLKMDGQMFGADKDTEYVRYLPHLANAYPESFLLNIIRDPRDVVLSRTKTPWGAKRSAIFHAAEYVHYLKRNRKEGIEFFADRYMEVRFEDLLIETKRTITSITKWLNLKLENQMLSNQSTNDDLIADDEREWKGNAEKEINTENTNKWKEELGENVVGLLEENLMEEMNSYEYSISGSKPGSVSRLMFSIYTKAFENKTKRERLNG